MSLCLQGKLILDCYVDKAELGTVNTIQDVIDRGIQIPGNGLLVHAGQLPIPEGNDIPHKHSRGSTNPPYTSRHPDPLSFLPLGSSGPVEVIMVRCAIGRTFCTEEEPRRNKSASTIPEG